MNETQNVIWCLFSVANAYDQPDHNLVAWWKDKPTYQQVAKRIGIQDFGQRDKATLAVVHIVEGKDERWGECDYRLEQVVEG